MRALLVLALVPGCAQLFGLEETNFVQEDAPGDASSVCDGAPACSDSALGRSACGTVFATGAQAGSRLRVAEPTGNVCEAGNAEGPCALTVTGVPLASYFDGTLTGQVQGQIDDCGRYVVPDLDQNAVDIAIVFTDQTAAALFNNTARLVLGRPMEIGTDRDVNALSVTKATTMEWGTQLNAAAPPETATGYLVTYTLGNQLIADMEVALDNDSELENPPGTVPWAAYFTSEPGYNALDGVAVGVDATGTSPSGTAFAVLPGGPFSLVGVRTGKRCASPMTLETVANTLVHVVQDGC